MSLEGEQSTDVELAVQDEVVIPDAVTDEVEIDLEDLEVIGDEPATTDDDELEEIEKDGKKFKIPKALKDDFLMHQDYTKKTQSVAEERKALEAQHEAVRQQAEFQQAHIQEIVKLNQIKGELSKFENVDWNALYDSDPVEAMKLDRHHKGLRDEFWKAQSTIQQAEQWQALNRQQETARLIEQSRATLASEIKDWSPETGKQVGEYLKSYSRVGINDQILKQIDQGVYGSLPIILAHKARMYDQLMEKAASKKPVSAPPPPPVTKVGSKATVTKSVSQMSDKEFAAWRAKQIKTRN
jgi:hypothetical protein